MRGGTSINTGMGIRAGAGAGGERWLIWELCVGENKIKDELNSPSGMDYLLKNQKG